MRVLIINLTRMGDLIQTIGLINAINRLQPDVLIDILVMKGFSPIVKHKKYINKIYTLNEEILNPSMYQNTSEKINEFIIWEGFEELYRVINNLNENKYDILFNPIVSEQSALLTYLIEAKQKLGMQKTRNNEQKLTCDFIAYQLANEHKLGDFSFNLVDIFAGMVRDIDSPPCSANPRLAMMGGEREGLSFKTELPEHNPYKVENKKIIGFHIGASQSNKAWNIKYYHKVISDLLKEDKYVIVLFGGNQEKEYKSFFENIKSDLFFNTIGDFKLDELIASIGCIDLMVTNDTGPMHIAVALDKPIVDISLGPVSKWETAPYSDKAIVIQARLNCHPCEFSYKCTHWDCHHAISAKLVVDVIKSFIVVPELASVPPVMPISDWLYKENKRFLKSLSEIGTTIGTEASSGTTIGTEASSGTTIDIGARLYATYFDQFGFHSVRPIFKEEITKAEYIFSLKRFIWSLYFIEKLQEPNEYYKIFIKDLKEDYLVVDFNFLDLKNYISELIDIVAKITKTLQQLCKTKNQRYLNEIKSDKQVLFNKAKEFELIYDWFSFLLYKESEIEDYDLVKIARKTIALYDVLKIKLTLFKDLLP